MGPAKISSPLVGENIWSEHGRGIDLITVMRELQSNIDSVPVTFREECSQFGQFCNSVGRIFRGKFVVEF